MTSQSGSSAPEAARAAEAARDLKWARMFAEAEDDWESCVNSIYGPSVAVFVYQDQVKAATALADLEVAAATSAAVAEERATTGRRVSDLIAANVEAEERIDAIEELIEKAEAERSRLYDGGLVPGYVMVDDIRAALASPGEET